MTLSRSRVLIALLAVVIGVALLAITWSRPTPAKSVTGTGWTGVTMTIKGQKTGNVKGEVTQISAKDQMLVYSVSGTVLAPRDPVSGLPTGKRQYKPITVVKAWDRSAPVLHQMLASNENLITVVITYWKPGRLMGSQTAYARETLTNANLAEVTDAFGPSLGQLVPSALTDRAQRISLTFQKATWEHLSTGTIAEDDWEPVSVAGTKAGK
jgi:type VI secretion system secreted protein Hcp